MPNAKGLLTEADMRRIGRLIDARLQKHLGAALSEAVNIILNEMPAESDRHGGYDGASHVCDDECGCQGARRNGRVIGFFVAPEPGSTGTPDHE